MVDFSDLDKVKRALDEVQEIESDNRELAREAHLFVDKPDGQWEPEWWSRCDKKPRYTFDHTSPIVDQVTGEIEKSDFEITIKPAGGNVTKDDASVFDGIVRTIQNLSNFTHIKNTAGRNTVTAGIDGWRIKHDYIDDTSFNQDLIIEPIHNFVDRVWFDPSAQRQDQQDAKYCFVLQTMTKADYDERFPEGSGQSVSDNRSRDSYTHKGEQVTVGQIYYVKHSDAEIVQMSDGSVYEDDEKFKEVKDELAAEGITEEKRRKIKKPTFYSRLFDGGTWLTDEQRTVFSTVPVIPVYGNFKVIEDKTVYRGVVQKLKDPQRVLNYSLSREIEEGALSPRPKYWMTQNQASGFESTLATMNTNADPVQFYNADPAAPGVPQQNGGAAINPGLRAMSESMQVQLMKTASLFAASMGDNPALQSGVAIEKLQDKGDVGSIKYLSALEVAICATGKLLVKAIPHVYDTKRQINLLKPDNAIEVITVNDVVTDEKTGKPVTLNDLSRGTYDVSCTSGPSFKNKQQHTVSGIIELAQVDPSIIQMGQDVLLSNMTAPGMELLAERARAQLLNAGVIPVEQMTEEEQQELMQKLAQQQEGQEGDPAAMLAQAEVLKGQAELVNAETNRAEFEVNTQEKAAKHDTEQQKLVIAERRENREDVKVKMAGEKAEFERVMQMQEAQTQQNAQIIENLNKQADTLNKLFSAMGVDSVVGPGNMEAYAQQAQLVQEGQEEAEGV